MMSDVDKTTGATGGKAGAAKSAGAEPSTPHAAVFQPDSPARPDFEGTTSGSSTANAGNIGIGAHADTNQRSKLGAEADRLRTQAGTKARDLAETGKEKTSSALRSLSETLEGAAQNVDDKLGPDYGRYARQAAQGISSFAATLDEKRIDELTDDARQFIRKSPAIAIGTAAAVGFALMRFLKAGTGQDEAATRADDGATLGGAPGSPSSNPHLGDVSRASDTTPPASTPPQFGA